MAAKGVFEKTVGEFYDSAIHAYRKLMSDDGWHHGDEKAHEAGLSPREAALDMQQQLVDAARIMPGHLVLDFGSGVGGPPINMAAMSGARFVGVCNNIPLTLQARKLAEERGMTDQVFFHAIGDTEYMTLGAWPDASFDAITYQESVVHLPDKQAFFHSAFRVLRPGGRLAAIDWVQRPWGEYQSAEQMTSVMAPANKAMCIPWHATIAEYRDMLLTAGFQVEEAVDLFPSGPCWGSTPEEDRDKWHTYDGPRGELFQDAKAALDNARALGVFSVGKLVAQKPNEARA